MMEKKQDFAVMNDILQVEVRKKLVFIRQKAALSREELAKNIGSAPEVIRKIEEGTDDISLDVLVDILNYYQKICRK